MQTGTFLSFTNVDIDQGFWHNRQQQNAAVTIYAIYEQFRKTGRFEALKLNWKEGEPNQPHIFWDSDVAKWIESAAYILTKHPDAKLETLADGMIDDIVASQEECGYFNSWFQRFEPQNRFTRRTDHELYCAGHLMEAAVAYYHATKKDKFLRAMCRYADYIETVFVKEHSASFVTPGHPEIELALVRLADCTGEKRYLELSKFFVDRRGTQEEQKYPWANRKYAQDHLPVRRQTTAEGHAVRAGYLYCAMADLAVRYDDAELRRACEAIWDNIVHRRMYITGGIGSATEGEAFTIDYDLPNLHAYSESCAAISLIFFAKRMLALTPRGEYADILEKALYNGFLSSISLDGKAFFYENPLAVYPKLKFRDSSMGDGTSRMPITQRVEVFNCSCCPPNISRLLATIGDYLYSFVGETLYIHQYIAGTAQYGNMTIRQTTLYPHDGEITITLHDCPFQHVAVRIPGWCEKAVVTCNGAVWHGTVQDGYALLPCDGDCVITLSLAMPVTLMEANPYVIENAGRVAVTRGPIVYCLEACDNGELLPDVQIQNTENAEIRFDEFFQADCILLDGWRHEPTAALYQKVGSSRLIPQRLEFIPYFGFANRGETEMQVWIGKR